MILRPIVQILAWLLVMAALVFVPAGDWTWPAGWIYLLTMMASAVAITVWLLQRDPALLAERLKFPVRREQKAWDRGLMALILTAFVAWTALAGIDAERFYWSEMPLILQALGLALIVACMVIAWLTFRENTFAVPVVRIQSERSQIVVTTGPYALVRHPMYAGALLFMIGQPLLLGSWLALAASPVLILLLAIRALGEERELAAALPGYADYVKTVRFRLVPGVW
ncbi:MAG: isoprenylcysteine carboxylmethyltransferase family protein [Proteobacteria bacterium]|nr:isoprenylcysteine carboxylmethyltransferase family protein [Pseudomonadota bacterium]